MREVEMIRERLAKATCKDCASGIPLNRNGKHSKVLECAEGCTHDYENACTSLWPEVESEIQAACAMMLQEAAKHRCVAEHDVEPLYCSCGERVADITANWDEAWAAHIRSLIPDSVRIVAEHDEQIQHDAFALNAEAINFLRQQVGAKLAVIAFTKEHLKVAPVKDCECALCKQVREHDAQMRAEALRPSLPANSVTPDVKKHLDDYPKSASDAWFAGKPTTDDLIALIMWELVECMETSEPEAPSNGRYVDSWHASACALRCFAMMLRLKDIIAKAESALIEAQEATIQRLIRENAVNVRNFESALAEAQRERQYALEKPCYILGATTISKIAKDGQLQTELVDFVVADELFHNDPYKQISALQVALRWALTHANGSGTVRYHRSMQWHCTFCHQAAPKWEDVVHKPDCTLAAARKALEDK